MQQCAHGDAKSAGSKPLRASTGGGQDARGVTVSQVGAANVKAMETAYRIIALALLAGSVVTGCIHAAESEKAGAGPRASGAESAEAACYAVPTPACLFAISLSTARGIDQASSRENVLAQIAVAQAKSGDVAGAVRTVRGIEDEDQCSKTLAAVAKAQVAAGDVSGALATALAIKKPTWEIYWTETRASVLLDIAKAQIASGDSTGARATLAHAFEDAKLIENRHGRFEALVNVVLNQAATGDLAGARRMAESNFRLTEGIPWPALEAKARLDAGNLEGALEATRSLRERYYSPFYLGGYVSRAGLLAAIAKARSERGDVAGAEATFAEAVADAMAIDDVSARTEILAEIAREGLVAGLISGAIDAGRRIEMPYWTTFLGHDSRAFLLAKLATAQAARGDMAGARLTFAEAIDDAKVIDNVDHRAAGLRVIAGLQAEAGEVFGAVRTIRGIDVPSWRVGEIFPATETRASWLAKLAKAQADSGDTAGAKASFAIAVEDTEAIRDADLGKLRDIVRNGALRDIAKYQAEAGFVTEARRTAHKIEDANRRASALGDIAAAQARVGDIAGAIETARGIEEDGSRRHAFGEIAVAQAEAGDIAGARLSAGGAYYPLARIIETQIASGDFSGARESARGIEDSRLRNARLVDIAGAEARAGHLARAIAAAREIEDAFSRARAFAEIAQAQAATM